MRSPLTIVSHLIVIRTYKLPCWILKLFTLSFFPTNLPWCLFEIDFCLFDRLLNLRWKFSEYYLKKAEWFVCHKRPSILFNFGGVLHAHNWSGMFIPRKPWLYFFKEPKYSCSLKAINIQLREFAPGEIVWFQISTELPRRSWLNRLTS